MSESGVPFGTRRAPVLHPFEFRGTGGEFFRIWIVNIALTLVTLGIFSAWAKVRTRRYFYGNTYLAGHAFDYHAVPWRILVGRLIALALFGAYNLSVGIAPISALDWIVIFAFAIPWLIVSSQRFNARNTSYRNVRFDFAGTYWGAFKAFILWPIAGGITLGGLIPLAHRARDYYYVNFHSYGGKPFATSFSGWSIYRIYLFALLMAVLAIFGIVAIVVVLAPFLGFFATPANSAAATPLMAITFVLAGVSTGVIWTAIITYVATAAFKLAIVNTSLDGRHKLEAGIDVGELVWIGLSNIVLVLVTIGLFYPWARVRYSRYLAGHMSLLAASNLDEFTSEAFATKSAIGEEIAGFFAFDFGL